MLSATSSWSGCSKQAARELLITQLLNGVVCGMRSQGDRASLPLLTFLGTRGGIEKRSARHRRHSALLLEHRKFRLMFDCGGDWLGRIKEIDPSAIVLTHAHPDHARGLAAGAPCPVYATAQTWALISHYPISDRHVIRIGKPFALARAQLEAIAVEHSVRAPAIGYRVAVGGTRFFYVPDLVSIRGRRKALRNVALYIGDGARVERPLLRRRGRRRIGHAAICTQLDWCRHAAIRHAIFTHCGSEIVGTNARIMAARLGQLGRERGVIADIAYDGMTLTLQAS